MLSENATKIIMILLAACHLLPFAASFLWVTKKQNGTVKPLYVCISGLVNGCAALFFSLGTLYGVFRCNPLTKLGQLVRLNGCYEDLVKLAVSCAACGVASAAFNFARRFVYRRFFRLDGFSLKKGMAALLLAFSAGVAFWGVAEGDLGSQQISVQEVCRKVVAEQLGKAVRYESYIVLQNDGVLQNDIAYLHLQVEGEPDESPLAVEQKMLPAKTTLKLDISQYKKLKLALKKGTQLALLDYYGHVLDELTIPAQEDGDVYVASLAMNKQGGNLQKQEDWLEAPVFSADSGFYEEAFSLTISAKAGEKIYYTLDSTDPTTESTLYTEPIWVYDRSSEPNQYRSVQNVSLDYHLREKPFGRKPVDKIMVVRAMAVDADGRTSDIVTKSYFVNLSQYAEGLTLSLVTDPYNLFDDEYGIYVTGPAFEKWYEAQNGNFETTPGGRIITGNIENYWKKGGVAERIASLSMFENGNSLLDQWVGIRIQGNARRTHELKPFSIYARAEYNGYDFFPAGLVNEFAQHAIYLRFNRQKKHFIICQELGRNRDTATIDYRKATLFLDGEFWYDTFLFEKFNGKNMAEKYGLSADNLVLVKNGEVYAKSLNQTKNYEDLRAWLEKKDLSILENYEAFGQILDIQSYIDTQIISMYMANMDCNERANFMYWYAIVPENDGYGDGRMRTALFDMDLAWKEMGQTNHLNYNMYVQSEDTKRFFSYHCIYDALRKNDEFCRQWVLTVMDMINTNLSTENGLRIMEELETEDAEMKAHFEKRAPYFIRDTAEEFGLAGTQGTVKLSSNRAGSPITLNTITPELKDGAWEGKYYTDYPVTVTANFEGFDHWEISCGGRTWTEKEKTIQVDVEEGGVQIYAVFK